MRRCTNAKQIMMNTERQNCSSIFVGKLRVSAFSPHENLQVKVFKAEEIQTILPFILASEYFVLKMFLRHVQPCARELLFFT